MFRVEGELCGHCPGATVYQVGAFPGPRIEGQPVAMATLEGPGRFTLDLPDGGWYLHAVGGIPDDRGTLNGLGWGSHGGIYGFGRPVAPGEPVRIHVSPLWRDLTHLPLIRGAMLSDDQWHALHRAMARLHEDLSCNIEGDLERAASLTRTRLSALFRRGVGVTMEEYRTRVRLEAAKALLVLSDAPVRDVALEVGYSAPAQLRRMFLRYLGVTPGEFRRLAQAVSESGPAQPPAAGSARRYGLAGALSRWLGPPRTGTVRGEVLYRGDREGRALYIGLFPGPLPDTYPAAWTAIPAPGPFTLRRVPEGRYYVLAAYLAARMRYPGDLGSGFAYGGYGDVDTSGDLARWNPVPVTVRPGDEVAGLRIELVDGEIIRRFGGTWLRAFLPDGR